MEIDWFTFVAQIINFLVLVWLLKKFLYGPITDAMKRRQQEIDDRLNEAQKRQEKVDELQREYQAQIAGWEAERQRLLETAKNEAEELRKKLTQQVHEEIEQMRARWHQALQHEQRSFLDNLHQHVTSQILNVVRKVLEDLSDSKLEDRIIASFSRQLQSVPDEEKDRIKQYLKNDGRELIVQTAFPCSEQAKNKIEQAVREHLIHDVPFQFDTSSELVAGIELKAGGYKIAWSIDGYLEGMERTLREAIDRELR